MAKKLKDYYGLETAELLAIKIELEYSRFDTDEFVKFVLKGIQDKEFLARQDVYVDALEKYLPNDYKKNISLFTKILGPKLQTETGMFTQGWWLWPIGRYLEKHGINDWDVSIKFIYELTQRFTGEYAIRPLLETNPKKTFKVMLQWSKDESVHVRRLSSEGGRITLPWSKKSTVCIDEFDLYKQILTNLNSDPSRFVQKSVGNNLNDLYKFSPKKAQEIIDEWKSQPLSKETEWIIKHGSRNLSAADSIRK